jgi:hypothetical protein
VVGLFVPPAVKNRRRLVPVEVELLNNTEGPFPTTGKMAAATVTTPVSPKLFNAILDVLNLPGTTLRLAGVAVILKSAFTVTVTIT